MERMKDVVKGRSLAQRNVSIGEKVRIYRECANLPKTIFAGRVGISLDVLDGIEQGIAPLNTALLMKISEELNVGYSDLFEAENEKYYPNLKDTEDPVYKLIKNRLRGYDYTYQFLADKIGINHHNISNYLARCYVPSPFDFQNICVLLHITSSDLRKLAVTKPAEKQEEHEKVVDEGVKEQPKDNAIMNNVINACNLYMQVEKLKGSLDEIINTAQKLKETLERYK